MERLSVMVTNGAHRLYDDPNGDLCLYADHQKALAENKRVQGSIIRDQYKKIEELSLMVEKAAKRVCE